MVDDKLKMEKEKKGKDRVNRGSRVTKGHTMKKEEKESQCREKK
jgi:hypothetical protein